MYGNVKESKLRKSVNSKVSKMNFKNSGLKVLIATFGSFAVPVAASTIVVNPSNPMLLNAQVVDTVTDNLNGTWHYSYVVTNRSTATGTEDKLIATTLPFSTLTITLPTINLFALPYFGGSGITNITGPAGFGWDNRIGDTTGTIDFGYGPGSQSIFWALNGRGIEQGDYLDVGKSLTFGYDAAYGPGKGPFAVGNSGNYFYGDPAIPLSPAAVAAGILPYAPVASVPVPSAAWLLAVGLCLVATQRRGRH
jgi:hypothetical protein